MSELIGRELLKEMLAQTPNLPGVYKMLSAQSEVLYVGKAKDLQNRIGQYCASNLDTKRSALVSRIHKVEYIILPSEEEALILESNLIREYQPPYNVIFKDDKSFPCIKIDQSHSFPSISRCRSLQVSEGVYGPFVSATALDAVFGLLQKVFKLRVCTDHYFATRKRPCIQYDIKRCTAPCVNYITKEKYLEDVKQAKMFLQGRAMDLQKSLFEQMEAYSAAQEYEKAAFIRDRLKAVTSIQQQSSKQLQNCDVIGMSFKHDSACLVVFSYRGGQNYGSRVYFPAFDMEHSEQDILVEFIMQFYRSRTPPALILLPFDLPEVAWSAINKLYKAKFKFSPENELVRSANANASMHMEAKLDKHLQNFQALKELASLFQLNGVPNRIEVYDNSHIMGKYPIGAVIVAGPDGIVRSECRIYTLSTSGVHGGDDYGMLSEVLKRRFSGKTSRIVPQLIIIDGGKGHLSTALEALKGLDTFVVAMAKGPNRNAGQETLFTQSGDTINLPSDSKLMHYLQRIRDEAHKLAINSYRKKHRKALQSSSLDAIPGVGDAKKKVLLGHFGSVEGVRSASQEQLRQVPGIGKEFAKKIYRAFRSELD